MLDLIYLALTALIFVLVSLVATGLERLSPRPRASAAPEALNREDQA
ncbi:hypothetical protein ACFVAE_08845 [Microbacterium sp. NPDC057659]